MDENIKSALNIQDSPPKASIDEIQPGSGTRYPILTLVAAVYRIAGWIMVAISIIGLFIGIYMLGRDSSAGLLMLLYSLIGGSLIALSCFFIAESMLVLTHIEENTRATKELLVKLTNPKSENNQST